MGASRVTKAFICGLGAGGVLAAGCCMFRVLMGDVENRLGSLNKQPVLTKFFYEVFPSTEGLFQVGLLLFAVGYGALALLNEPSPMLCVLHVLLAVVFIAVLSAMLTHVQIHQCIKIFPDGYVPPPWFQPSRDLPWLLFCSMPLGVAAIVQRARKVRKSDLV